MIMVLKKRKCYKKDLKLRCTDYNFSWAILLADILQVNGSIAILYLSDRREIMKGYMKKYNIASAFNFFKN